MTETLTIQVSLDEKSMAALAALTEAITNMPASTTDTLAETKPATKPATKPKPKAKPKPKPKPEPKPEPEETEEEADESAVTREDVRGKLKELGSAVDQASALGILTKFGAKTMSALKEEDFQEAYEEAQALIDGAADGDALDS